MNIGIDIDGVLTNMQDYVFEYGSKYSYKLGRTLKQLKKDEYDTSLVFNWSKDVDDNFWIDTMEEYVKHERPRIFASEVIKKLHENHNIIIITARHSMTEEDKKERKIEKLTEAWLMRNDIPYDKLLFPGSDKRQAIIDNEIDVMIEDSPSNIEQLREYCDIIVFDAMYNKNCCDLIRVNSWYEILYYINSSDKLIRNKEGELIEHQNADKNSNNS